MFWMSMAKVIFSLKSFRRLKMISGALEWVSSGIIEFANKNLVFEENDKEILIYLRWLEGCTSYETNLDGSTPLITIDYKYNVDNLALIERKLTEECVFTAGAEEWEIRVKIFRDAQIKQEDFNIRFTLQNPQGGAVLGEQDYMIISIYDVEIVDPVQSYASINGEYNNDAYKNIKIGEVTEILVYSHLANTDDPNNNGKKTDGIDLFFVKILDRYWNTTTNLKEFSNNLFA